LNIKPIKILMIDENPEEIYKSFKNV